VINQEVWDRREPRPTSTNVLPAACWQPAIRRQLAGSQFRPNETFAQPPVKAYQLINVSQLPKP
jgi:hypothetical protein